MGNGFVIKCEKCGFKHNYDIGIGFLYPEVCEDILNSMKLGNFGDELMRLANTIPNVAVHQCRAVFVCDDCGSWRVDDVIDLCSPIAKKKRFMGLFRTKEEIHTDKPYVMDAEIGHFYKVIHSVERRCTCCQQKMRAVAEDETIKQKLKCPECGEILTIEDVYCWD